MFSALTYFIAMLPKYIFQGFSLAKTPIHTVPQAIVDSKFMREILCVIPGSSIDPISTESIKLLFALVIICVISNHYFFRLELINANKLKSYSLWQQNVTQCLYYFGSLWLVMLALPIYQWCHSKFPQAEVPNLIDVVGFYFLILFATGLHLLTILWHYPSKSIREAVEFGDVGRCTCDEETKMLKVMVTSTAVFSLFVLLMTDLTVHVRKIVQPIDIYIIPVTFMCISSLMLALIHKHETKVAQENGDYNGWLVQNRIFLCVVPFVLVFLLLCMIWPLPDAIIEIKVTMTCVNYFIYFVWFLIDANISKPDEDSIAAIYDEEKGISADSVLNGDPYSSGNLLSPSIHAAQFGIGGSDEDHVYTRQTSRFYNDHSDLPSYRSEQLKTINNLAKHEGSLNQYRSSYRSSENYPPSCASSHVQRLHSMLEEDISDSDSEQVDEKQ